MSAGSRRRRRDRVAGFTPIASAAAACVLPAAIIDLARSRASFVSFTWGIGADQNYVAGQKEDNYQRTPHERDKGSAEGSHDPDNK